MATLDEAGPDPLDLVERLFPVPQEPELQPGDWCMLDGDHRTHRIASIHGDMAVVYVPRIPSVTYRRVRLDDCIPYPEAEAG
jgi:hypothetical protein